MANKKTSKELNEFIANQRKYWQDRALKEFEAGEKSALEVSNNLKSSYDRAIREIENKINSFYGKYAEKEGITLAEAKKLLNKKELKSFKSYLDEWIKDKSIRDKEKSELNLLKARTNVSRLEELKTGIKYELEKLTGQNVVEIEDLLTKTYNNAYKNTIKDISNFTGQGISFTSVDSNRVQKAISQQYLGSNYSKSIWNNEQRLLNTLEQDIPRGLILGYNPKKLAAQVSKDIGANYNNTVRLIRTEYAKVNNEATMQGYKNAGIKKYEILEAPDHRTCDYCEELDGKVFNVSEAEAGYNMPPFHANCRGTTVAHFEDEDYEDAYDYNFGNYNENDIGGSGVGTFIEKIKTNNLDAKIAEYKEEIRNENNEFAFLIDKDYNVYKYEGNATNVNVKDRNIKDAIIIHNHPTIASFGKDDFDIFANIELKELIAVDRKYDYSVKVIKKIDKLYNDFYKEGMDILFRSNGEEEQHCIMLAMERLGYVKYRRRERE